MSTQSVESLTPLPDNGKPTSNERLESPEAAVQLFNTFRQADELSAQNRTIVNQMLSGAPPYDQAALLASGAGGRFNVNRGDGAALLEAACAGYTDLLDSVEMVLRPFLPRTYKDPIARGEEE